jgi:hypothetical protein
VIGVYFVPIGEEAEGGEDKKAAKKVAAAVTLTF